MRESERIAEQAHKMIAGDAWHGPATLEVLADVDAERAAAHPIPAAHSIWELVLHIVATHDVLLLRLAGEPAGATLEEYWPSVPDVSPAAWAETLAQLEHKEALLRRAMAAFPEDRLDLPLVPTGSSAYNNFHGHVQHNAYHSGQIALLKRAMQPSAAQR